MENRVEQNVWNIVFTALYVGLVFVGLWVLVRVHGALPQSIPFFDLVLITLATFRLIRLFVYDKVTRWFRDIFAGSKQGPAKTLSDLLACPWCLGLWVATAVTFFYFLIPEIAWVAILVVAVAGVASALQLLANWIGWSAEKAKLKTAKLERGE